MIISSRKKFIFFHLSKVAGSSINNALRKYADIPFDRLYNYMFDYLGEQRLLGLYERHIRPWDLKKKLDNHKFDTYFKFAFVRNPWDWHVSAYHYNFYDSNAIWHSIVKEKSFEEYLEWVVQNIEQVGANQYGFLADPDGNLLVDFVGKFENLDEDFERICGHLNIKENLPRKNTSKRELDYRKYYTAVSKELVSEYFKKDIDFFQYTF